MTLTSPRWKNLIAEATRAQGRGMPVVQIATVDENNLPRIRSISFREFLESPGNPSLPLLIFSTDIRSNKVAQLIAQPKAELVWWIESTEQQFRISVDVHLCTRKDHPLFDKFKGDVESAGPSAGLSLIKAEELESRLPELFRTLPPHIRATMYCPPHGTLRKEGDQYPTTLMEPNANSDEETKKMWSTALSNFVLIVLDPTAVEMVEVDGKFENTRFFKRPVDGGYVWDEQNLY